MTRGHLNDTAISTTLTDVTTQKARTVAADPLQALIMQAGVDLLPPWARRMHGAVAATEPLVDTRQHIRDG